MRESGKKNSNYGRIKSDVSGSGTTSKWNYNGRENPLMIAVDNRISSILDHEII